MIVIDDVVSKIPPSPRLVYNAMKLSDVDRYLYLSFVAQRNFITKKQIITFFLSHRHRPPDLLIFAVLKYVGKDGGQPWN